MFTKSPLNPILRSDDIKLPWANLKVYNAGIVFDCGVFHLLFRAIGNNDFISRIGYGKSYDGIHFDIDSEPVMSPVEAYEKNGCEDPRITKIDGTYYMTYTAFEGRTARAAITASNNLKTWGKRSLLFPDWHDGLWNKNRLRPFLIPGFDITTWNQEEDSNWSKAAAIFPEKIDDTYYLFFGDEHIWSATSKDLYHWDINPTPVLSARPGMFDQHYVEMGPPPFKTPDGWLCFYHGISGPFGQQTYCIGAALCDSSDPTKVLWRSQHPLVEPTEVYETIGLVDVMDGGWSRIQTITHEEIRQLATRNKLPKTVFCSGAVEVVDKSETVYNLYYSGADTVLCLAYGTLKDIINA